MEQLKEIIDQIRAGDALRSATKDYVRKHRRQPRQTLRLVTAASCVLVLFLVSGWLYFTPTAHISIDIDPSLELGINRFDRVVSASSSSLSDRDLMHLTYAEAMDEILSNPTVTELVSNGEVMTVSVIAPEGNQSSRLMSEAQACTKDQKDAQCYHADPDAVADAPRLGLSKGQYRALKELQELDPSITAEDIRGLSMRQIRAMLEDLLRQQNPPGSKDPENPPPKPPADEPPSSNPYNENEESDKGNGNGNGSGNGNGKGNQNGKKPGGEGGKGPKNSP